MCACLRGNCDASLGSNPIDEVCAAGVSRWVTTGASGGGHEGNNTDVQISLASAAEDEWATRVSVAGRLGVEVPAATANGGGYNDACAIDSSAFSIGDDANVGEHELVGDGSGVGGASEARYIGALSNPQLARFATCGQTDGLNGSVDVEALVQTDHADVIVEV